jgi:PAS domain S-box-containing protein
MTVKADPIGVAIVGGGPGCKAIMDMILGERLKQLRMKLIGVACTNPGAVGYRYAQEQGIYTTKNYRDLFRLQDLHMIIELTGREEVANEISRTKPDHVGLMDHVAARLFWDIFQIEEQRLAERRRTEETLRQARDELEVRVKERTAQLVESNARLRSEVNERQLAEAGLKESEERLRTILDYVPVGILIIHAESRKIVDANTVATRLIDLPKEKIVGRVCHKFVCPELEGGCPITDFGQSGNLETVILRADGEAIPILKTVFPIILDGQTHLLESFLDITDQKQVEAKLRKKNRELENFVNVVSHDLKTPIISVQGFSSRLLKHCQGQLDDKARKYLEQIQTSARRMEVFVSDLLTLARVGGVPATYEQVSSSAILEDIEARIRGRLEDKGVAFVVAKDLPLIYADRQKMSQVFENLIVNAIKFSAVAEGPRVEVGYADEGKNHHFFVKDNGIGVDPKYHRKIFEMFFRLNEIDDKEGTGIGLAIVESIVTGHGGRVWVESEKGHGATFHFTIPKAL